MAKGWVKIHREMTSHWVWDCEFSTGQAWVDLLMSACHKPNKFQLKGQLVELKIGQLARSEVTLAKDWKWSRNRVRRFLNNLENDGMIEQQKGHLTSIITICNYSDFQTGDTSSDTANETGSDTSEGHLTEHKQECLIIKESLKDLSACADVPAKKTKSKPEPIKLDEQRILDVWNELGCIRHRSITKEAVKQITKTYKEYCKATETPAQVNDWIVSYLKNGFAKWMTDHHRQLNDGKWAADLAFAVRHDTYDRVKSTVVTKQSSNAAPVPEMTKEERDERTRRELEEREERNRRELLELAEAYK